MGWRFWRSAANSWTLERQLAQLLGTLAERQGVTGPDVVATCPPDTTLVDPIAVPTLRNRTRAVLVPIFVTLATVGSAEVNVYIMPATRKPLLSRALATTDSVSPTWPLSEVGWINTCVAL